jgi:hypothetical protein
MADFRIWTMRGPVNGSAALRRTPVAAALLGLALLPAGPAAAVDHNNVDAHRPLSFDDAETLAFREQALEFGLRLGSPRHRPLGVEFEGEYLYGFARNSHAAIGFSPSVGGRAGAERTSFDLGDVSLGVLHNFNRQYHGTPALSLRGDVFLPGGSDSRGAAMRLRGIASKQAGQYGRLHLNVDLNAHAGAPAGQRDLYPGVVLGFTHPLGYPTRFDTTGLAEIGFQGSANRGQGGVVTAGLGLRRQVSVRSVVDVGIQADLVSVDGAPRDRLRLVAGYSVGF